VDTEDEEPGMTTVKETFQPIQAVGSSHIESFSFDPDTDTLHVVFVGGDEGDYLNVPVAVYRGWTQARDSFGKYWVRHIKDRYAYVSS
jgi:hypothetical protein